MAPADTQAVAVVAALKLRMWWLNHGHDQARTLLRIHHEMIEAWILEQAGIVFDAKAEPDKLRIVVI